MISPGGTLWPPLETAYTDEFGEIDPEVYAVAGRLWGQGERFALSALGDAANGLRLMVRAAAIVTRKQAAPDYSIANVSAYLFQTYKHLVLAELEKENNHRQSETTRKSELEWDDRSPAKEVDRRILIQQLMLMMDDWMREVFELLTLGHSFEEIGKIRNENAHVLRNKFNKRLKSLAKRIQADS